MRDHIQHVPLWDRRSFLKSTGALAAGMTVAGATQAPAAAKNPAALALDGGARAVTIPADRHQAILKWMQYGDAEKEVIRTALDCNSGNIYRYNGQLEGKWRQYNQVPFAKTFNHGTSAFTAMFFALDLPPGSEIMVPSYQFFGAILPMRLFGYVPVFVDINPRTATIDVEHAKRVITPNCRAIMAMHSWGLPCEMDLVNDFAKEHNLSVLEDCAHAHGATMQGKMVGNWSRMAAYSFQGTKPLPGIEGGMGVYHNRPDFERAVAFGHYEECGEYLPGVSPIGSGALAKDSPYRKYTGTGLCMKLRMHPLAAVIILKQLEGYEHRIAMTCGQVRQLNDRICQLPGLSEPVCRKDQKRVYYSTNTLFLDEKEAGMSRETVVKALAAEGLRIGAAAYPENHKYTVYAEPQWWHHPPTVPKMLPGCEAVNSRVINVGLFHQEAPELIEQYAKAFEKVWAHREKLARA